MSHGACHESWQSWQTGQRCVQTPCGSLRCWRSDKLVILQYVQMWLYELRGFVSEATATSLWCSAEHVPTSCLGVAGR